MSRISPSFKAAFITAFFALFGIGALISARIDWSASLPLIIFYAVITLNTYFSVKLFTGLTMDQSSADHCVDGILVILYALLAVCFAQPLWFAFVVTLLFAVATLKYALLLGRVRQPRLLKRKIAIDTLGTVMGILSLGAAFAGYPSFGSWFLALVFAAANMLLLFIWPMYRLD